MDTSGGRAGCRRDCGQIGRTPASEGRVCYGNDVISIPIGEGNDCFLILEVPTVIKAEKECRVGKYIQCDTLRGEQTNSPAKVPN